ncbi:hypothetical protein CcaverHIS002_0409350 [Cutaneotrichosporon cavernicola]|uniref:MARVEL domain-containing protein n=1 Tax=Cutaneotrichosporon cavernicola TaxID=279322 RepID=A0AA48L545_9TREE|nr:uncharacterized protein CcaverHIS019_0409280 [Cutaneotrichosporon cavernicola]BEI84331.1 hypothetical protein CcaverHIS002_0409350 [Cutaneotrichosporon cavernicola]BEI92108.1 hypothetical protein CcaverHIS019_0409280 [Cutaneotrichosporon cavernicola]BEI99878.1 hypothetical protein CcaverHIS631_0409210 [Cutaneotrichosporon cavernicola]
MNERTIRITHGLIFLVVFIVSYYNKNGYPPQHNAAYRDRIRITLVASVWTCVFALFLGIGFQVAGHNLAFGILSHLIPMSIAFLLFLIGVSSLTALISKVSCDDPRQNFAKCQSVWALMGAGWAETILVFIALMFIIGIAFKARAWGGVRRQTMYVD